MVWFIFSAAEWDPKEFMSPKKEAKKKVDGGRRITWYFELSDKDFKFVFAWGKYRYDAL